METISARAAFVKKPTHRSAISSWLISFHRFAGEDGDVYAAGCPLTERLTFSAIAATTRRESLGLLVEGIQGSMGECPSRSCKEFSNMTNQGIQN